METGFLLLLGLAIGSFIGAVTWRLRWNIPISKGRSFCDHCHKQINWFDNIPVLSYILLRGKCRNCRKKIPVEYPIIEIVFAIFFVGTNQLLPLLKNNIALLNVDGPLSLLVLPYLLIVVSILLGIFITDIKYQLIFDEMSFALFFITIIFMLITSYNNFYLAILSGALCSIFLLLIHLVTKGRGMGLGDVKLALFGGAILGLPLSLGWMALSFIIGAAVGLMLILFRKTKFGSHIAFGPFMIVALLFVCLFGKLISILIF